MISSIVNAFQARNISLAISCSALLLGCLATAPKTPTFSENYQQWSQKYVEMLNLARAGKCDETIKSFEHLVKTYPDFSTAGQSLIKRSSSPVATCFINAGRANEVVKQFENLCIPGKTIYLDLQRDICTEENLQGAAAAYKLVGRENPFVDPQIIVKQIVSNHEAAIANSKIELKNIEYTAGLQAAIRAIFARVVTQRPGYSHETRLHYQQSKIATTEAIAFIDAQAPKCKVARNDYCLKTLAEDRRRYADYFVELSKKLNESLEDQAAARRIAGMAPAILSVIANAGEKYAAANPIRQSPQISTPSISSTRKPIAPPVSTTSQNPYATNSPAADSSGVTARQPQSKRRPYKPNANSCIALSGNQLVNNCAKAVWVTFCVTNPKQTKNFFDSSGAFTCPTHGGLERISGNGRNGLVWHGWVHFFACEENDIGTMKTRWHNPLANSVGTHIGLCGGPDAPNSSDRFDSGSSLYAE
ncbi:MAG: hypothetical protein V4857_10415 [Pseudomonadota bacterium]